jgi:glucosyl-3-phosphoglycerate synthase
VRTFDHSAFSPGRLREERRVSISVCVPTREEAETIAGVVAPLVALREAGVVDQVVVADADSADGTGAIAADLGAEVHRQAALLPGHGPVLGKGDAMWRALSVLEGELVCFVDGDSADFGAHFACGLLGPLVCTPGVELVKGAFRRPFRGPAGTEPAGGGRVTELVARPLLRAFHPELAWLRQPLAGEVAARRELLEGVPFTTGYGVDIGLLLDVTARVGPEAIAEVDLGTRQNRHQPLEDLAPMADAVMAAVHCRLRRDGRLAAHAGGAEPVERPALASLQALRRAG